MILADLVLTFSLSLVFSLLKGDEIFEIYFLREQSLSTVFFSTVILAPIIETFTFQFLTTESLIWIFRKMKIPHVMFFSILISGVAFGSSHGYNMNYVLVAILIGLLYGVYYFIARYHHRMNAFLTICIVHSISNLIGFDFDDWLGVL
ncbi:CPBP family glutamic-type intramembrane protease [Pleomorphovibrio marinus]|uniref:CPBP family glutamic-type intramembrane protease n=1 Tax=Pleomorphovibrio marinus TaxID=2164132 RepID=UPI0018E53179